MGTPRQFVDESGCHDGEFAAHREWTRRYGQLQPLVESNRVKMDPHMDKLRALEYFIAAAEGASLSAAARHHGVSVAAVAKLIGALESDLNVKLLERRSKGIVLTAAGNAYLDSCRPLVSALADADDVATGAMSKVRGTVVVGVQPVIAQECLTAALPRFLSAHPEVQLDMRYFMRPTEEQVRGVDVMLVVGWPQADDLVQRRLGAVSYVVCAAPAYWTANGMPRHPSELAQHNCLCVRSSQTGAVMDLWRFRKGEEEVAVVARGTVVADNIHRDLVRDLMVAGVGVGRILEWDTHHDARFATGALVPALRDWVSPEVPPVTLLHPPSVRRIPRVRLFIDWVAQLFADIEHQRQAPLPATGVPRWLRSQRLRTSATPEP
jgi:LysR family transcriptional regulator, regulator for bpeEF and oprC